MDKADTTVFVYLSDSNDGTDATVFATKLSACRGAAHELLGFLEGDIRDAYVREKVQASLEQAQTVEDFERAFDAYNLGADGYVKILERPIVR